MRDLRGKHGIPVDLNEAEGPYVIVMVHTCELGQQIKAENPELKVIDFGLSDFDKPDERLNDIVEAVQGILPRKGLRNCWFKWLERLSRQQPNQAATNDQSNPLNGASLLPNDVTLK